MQRMGSMRLLLLWAVICLLGCGSVWHGTEPENAATSGKFPLPSPQQALAQLAVKSTATPSLSRWGREFDPGLNQRCSSSGDYAVLSPAWVNNTSDFETASFAVFHYVLEGSSGALNLSQNWDSAPTDYGKLWVGLSNWAHDRWDWFQMPATGKLPLSFGQVPLYVKPGTYENLVAVVLLGTTPASLNRMWYADAAGPGYWNTTGATMGRNFRVPVDGPASPRALWSKSDFFSHGLAAVFDADGTAYVTTYSAGFQALNPDGTIRWSFDKSLGGPVSICSDGTAIVATHEGDLRAYSPDGSLIWQRAGLQGTPAITTSGSILALAPDRTLYALDSAGNILWTKEDLANGIEATLLAGPVDSFYAFSGLWYGNCRIYAFDEGGTTTWTYEAGTALACEPIVGEDGAVYFAQCDGTVTKLTPDGTKAWTYGTTADVDHSLALGLDGMVFALGLDGVLSALSETGQLLWWKQLGSSQYGALGSMAVDKHGVVYTGGPDFKLYAVNSDGTVKWTYQLDEVAVDGPSIRDDGALFVITDAGTLYVIGDAGVKYGVSGYVKHTDGSGFPGVTLVFNGSLEPVQTNQQGYWHCELPPVGEFTVTPGFEGYTFEPVSSSFSANWGDVTVPDFIGTPIGQTYTASGYVVDETNTGLPGVTIRFSGGLGAVTTDAAGYWQRDNVPPGTYTAVPSRAGWLFEPVNREFTVIDAPMTVDNFVGRNNGGSQEDWSMVGRNAAHNARSPFVGPNHPITRWTFDGVSGNIGPVLGGDGTVYMCDTYIRALTHDGVQKWSYVPPASVKATPAVGTDGTLYALVGTGTSQLVAVDPDGVERWSYDVGPGTKCSSITLGPDDVIYFNAAANLYAVNPDGALKWSCPIEYASTSTPALAADGTVYVGGKLLGSPALYAVSPTGTVNWTYTTQDVYYIHDPTIGDEGTIYFNAGANLYALQPDGVQAWIAPLNGTTQGSLAIDSDGTIILGDDVYLRAFNSDGTDKWALLLDDHFDYTGSPVIDAAGTIYVYGDGYLHAIEADGTLRWMCIPSGGAGTVLAIGADGTVYNRSSTTLSAIGPGNGSDCYSIYGTVVDQSANPLSDASVMIHPTIGTATTDINGEWRVDNLPNGTYYICVYKQHYAFAPSSFSVTVHDADAQAPDAIGTSVADGRGDWWANGHDAANTCQSAIPLTARPSKRDASFSSSSGFVFAADGTMFNGSLKAYKPDGTELWTVATATTSYMPAINNDGLVCFTTNEGKLYAYTQDGQLTWQYDLGGSVTGQFILSPMGDYIVPIDHNILLAITPALTEHWRYGNSDLYLEREPAVAADGTVYIGLQDHRLIALQPDGVVKWETVLSMHTKGRPAIGADGTIVVRTADYQIQALDADGQLKWTFLCSDWIDTDPVIANDGTVCCSDKGTTYVLNPDGSLRFSSSTGNASSFTILGQMFDSLGNIWVAGTKLYCFLPDGTPAGSWPGGSATAFTPCIDQFGRVLARGSIVY